MWWKLSIFRILGRLGLNPATFFASIDTISGRAAGLSFGELDGRGTALKGGVQA